MRLLRYTKYTDFTTFLYFQCLGLDVDELLLIPYVHK